MCFTLVNGACKGCLLIPQDTWESHLRGERTRHNIDLEGLVPSVRELKCITPVFSSLFQPTTMTWSTLIPIDASVAIYAKMKLSGKQHISTFSAISK